MFASGLFMDREPHALLSDSRQSEDASAKHRRRSLRLKEYDYAQAGAYFVTICTQHRACLFGDVVDGAMRLSAAGHLAATLWNDISARFPGIDQDAYVVMPNHIHGIILLPDRASAREFLMYAQHAITTVGAPLVGAQSTHASEAASLVGAQRNGAPDRAATRAAPTIGDVVGAFKSLFAVAYIRGVKENRWPAFDRRVWQRNYYEHIIRDEMELARIRRYIDENPLQWAFDRENPQCKTITELP